jgi:hypothetical protein
MRHDVTVVTGCSWPTPFAQWESASVLVHWKDVTQGAINQLRWAVTLSEQPDTCVVITGSNQPN